MGSAELLADGFGRVQGEVHAVVGGLTADQMAVQLDPDANSIAWLCWHLARIQDVHLVNVLGVPQVWPEWAPRFGMTEARGDGYGDTPQQVAQVRASADLLTGYYDAVHAQAIRLVSQLTDSDLARAMDERSNPPLTLSALLMSVLSDCLQHAGQAAFIRGALLRRS